MNYLTEIRDLIKDKRKTSRIWQRTRKTKDKRMFNQINIRVNRTIKGYKQSCINEILNGVGPEKERDHSL